jgi:hypothetical protein
MEYGVLESQLPPLQHSTTQHPLSIPLHELSPLAPPMLPSLSQAQFREIIHVRHGRGQPLVVRVELVLEGVGHMDGGQRTE